MIWVAVIITMLLFILVAKPMGIYLEKAFQGSKMLDKVFGPFEKLIFKIMGVKEYNQTWKQYALSLVLLNGFMIVIVYFIFRLQGVLPLNPAHIEGMEPTLAFNTAISFMADTNLQHYSGENGLSYLSQLIGITFLMFAAPATTLALVMAFIRGLAGKELGNFFVDFTRALTRVFLPIAFIAALVFVALGVPQTLDGAVTAQTIDGAKQSILRGPVASFVSIKELGNNGGGFFGANSTHPFENPGQMSNILQMMLMMLLPTALPFTYGRMVGNKKQGRILFVSLFMVFLLGFITITTSELNGKDRKSVV